MHIDRLAVDVHAADPLAALHSLPEQARRIEHARTGHFSPLASQSPPGAGKLRCLAEPVCSAESKAQFFIPAPDSRPRPPDSFKEPAKLREFLGLKFCGTDVDTLKAWNKNHSLLGQLFGGAFAALQ